MRTYPTLTDAFKAADALTRQTGEMHVWARKAGQFVVMTYEECEAEKKQYTMVDIDYAVVEQRVLAHAYEDRLCAAAPELLEALKSIAQYGADTLSGPVDGPDDRKWQSDGVLEMTKRARAAIAKVEGCDE